MSRPTAREGDRARSHDAAHNCRDCEEVIEGPATTGSDNVHLNGRRILRLCDRGTHTNCPDSRWRAVEGAATVFVNRRPVVRLGDDSQHCDGMGELIEGSEDCLIGGPSAFASTTPIEAVVGWIYAKMLEAAGGPLTEHIRDLRDRSLVDFVIPAKQDLETIEAFRLFAIYNWPDTQRSKAEYFAFGDEEQQIGIWDYKSDIHAQHGEWAYDPAGDRSYAYDVWSNILFGYNGRAAGFSTAELKSGAGAGQIVAGTSSSDYWNSWFDDPRDIAAMEIGIDLWEEHGLDLTEQQLLDALRTKSDLDAPRGVRRNC